MNGLLLTIIIITLFICRVNANERNRIVVMAPNVQEETVQSLSERFYDARDVYEYVAYGESSDTPSTKDFIVSIQEFIETYISSSSSSWLRLIVLAPRNHENNEKTDDTNSIVRFRNLLQSQTTKNISATFFVPRKGGEEWIDLLGSPLESVEYADRSGFNAALTLRSYLQEDEGITPRLTLQRVFLQLGYNARSFFHDELRVCTPEQNARMSCCCDRVVDRVSSLHASFALDSDASSNTRISVPLERHHLFLQPRVSVVSNDEETCLEEEEMSSSSNSAISMSESCEESTDYTEEHVVIGDVPRLDMETTSMTPEDIVSQGLPYILHFSSVSKWSAFTKWQDLNYLRQALEKNLTTMFRVKSGNGKGRDGT